MNGEALEPTQTRHTTCTVCHNVFLAVVGQVTPERTYLIRKSWEIYCPFCGADPMYLQRDETPTSKLAALNMLKLGL